MLSQDASSEGVVGGIFSDAGKLLRVNVTIMGKTPIMFNRLTPEQLERIRDKVRAPPAAEKLSKEEEAKQKLYMVDDKPVLPVENIMACLIEAGRFVKYEGKKQISTRTDTVLPSFLIFEDPYFEIKSEAGWSVDFRAGKNAAGQVVALCRPRFDDWKITLSIQIDTNEIGESKIKELFEIAGKRIGLCEFRPARKGIYGQFLVQCWQVVESSQEEAA